MTDKPNPWQLLDELQKAEAGYRLRHDRFGDGSISAGKAWDDMRHAGDAARAALALANEPADGGGE